VGERPPAGWNGLFPHAVNGRDGIDMQFFNLWQASPFADAYLGRLAAALVDSFSLGQRQTTDYLGVSFSVLDDVGHAFGPESREIEDVLRRLDVTLGTLIRHLDAKVGRANYVLALSADHGVAPIPIPPKGGRIVTDDVRERIEDALVSAWGPLQKSTYVELVNFTDVYFAGGVFDRLRANTQLLSMVIRSLEEIPGVARVLRTDQLSETSQDPIIRKAALSYMTSRSGDLMIVPKEYWFLGGRNVAAATTHGTHHDYDTHVPMILLGGAVKSARSSANVTPADIAPTLGSLAGVRLPQAEGHALIGGEGSH
jgi:predicted AlkP superfamily pyrophosphatase or phosphodiesterase